MQKMRNNLLLKQMSHDQAHSRCNSKTEGY